MLNSMAAANILLLKLALASSDYARRAYFGAVPFYARDADDRYVKMVPVGSFTLWTARHGGDVWVWTADAFPNQPGFVALRGKDWGQ